MNQDMNEDYKPQRKEEILRGNPELVKAMKPKDFWEEEQSILTLPDRLRGFYPVGPFINGEPEFGWRYMAPLWGKDANSVYEGIRYQAAQRIEELENQLALTEEALKESGYCG